MSESGKVRKTDLLTVILHGILVVTVFFSLSTGLRISADSEGSFWSRSLDLMLLQGDVMRWHVWAAFTLTGVAIAYAAYLVFARLHSRVALDRARVKAVTSSDRHTRWSAINVVVYWLAFVLIALAALTGMLLYLFSGVLPHSTVIVVHRVVAWLFIAYILLHIVTQFSIGGARQLLKIVNPRIAYGAATAIALSIAGVSATAIYNIEKSAIDELRVVRTSQPPIIDGDPLDPAWSNATPVEIATNRGVNQPDGAVTVTVRALHDGGNLYMLMEWPDSTRSQKHLPLVKTEGGWKVIQSEFGIQDEDLYYEDKLGIMIARSSQMAGAGSTHLGPKPLSNRPAPSGGRGLHYTTDGSIVDVWHWKSVRSGSTAMKQIDDNYFGPPLDAPSTPGKRYTGGYTKDPSTGGGFQMNWKKYSDGIVEPLRLPKDASVLQRFGKVDLDPNTGDSGELWMPMALTVPYREDRDHYPVGTIMPSVLIKGPFEGDRGDVTAVSRWSDGWWRLEITRKLDTGSSYDVALNDQDPAYLWVAVFDHAQTRHSLHLHPVQVIVEQ